MTKAERCLAQAQVFGARAQVAASEGVARAIAGDEHGKEKYFTLSYSFLHNMDEATSNALHSNEEERNGK